MPPIQIKTIALKIKSFYKVQNCTVNLLQYFIAVFLIQTAIHHTCVKCKTYKKLGRKTFSDRGTAAKPSDGPQK